jgi:NitT/TauT family transport system permease protein
VTQGRRDVLHRGPEAGLARLPHGLVDGASEGDASAGMGIRAEDVEQRVRTRRRERWGERLALLSPIVILLVWEVLSSTNTIDKRFFPPPSSIVDELHENLDNGKLLGHVRDSLSRILIGFLIGSGLGLVVGLALGMFRLPRLILGPVFAALYPVPKIAIFPLLLIIFGLGDASKWAAIAIGAFFLVFYNTLGGVLQIPTIFLDVARNAGASRLQVFRTVALPAALPDVFTGLRLATGTSFVILAAAEFVGAKSGLGVFIWTSWMTLQVDRMYLGIVVLALLGYLSITFVSWLEARLVPWAARH